MSYLNHNRRVSRCRKPWCQQWVSNRWQAKSAHDTQHAKDAQDAMQAARIDRKDAT